MELKDLISLSKISFNDCFAELDTGTRLDWSFDISPSEFLSFSKSDFKEGGKRGAINSLANAKRAIDCQVDRVFKALGYEFNCFPSYLKEFCRYFCESKDVVRLPEKLKVINAFGMAPAGLVSSVRALRNKVEHYYNVPSIDDVKMAIEVAELFIAATERKLIDFWGFEITDKKHKDNSDKGKLSGLYITRDLYSDSFEVRYYCPFSGNRYKAKVLPENESYAPMMRMCITHDQNEEFSKSLKYLLKVSGHQIPEHKVSVYVV